MVSNCAAASSANNDTAQSASANNSNGVIEKDVSNQIDDYRSKQRTAFYKHQKVTATSAAKNGDDSTAAATTTTTATTTHPSPPQVQHATPHRTSRTKAPSTTVAAASSSGISPTKSLATHSVPGRTNRPPRQGTPGAEDTPTAVQELNDYLLAQQLQADLQREQDSSNNNDSRGLGGIAAGTDTATFNNNTDGIRSPSPHFTEQLIGSSSDIALGDHHHRHGRADAAGASRSSKSYRKGVSGRIRPMTAATATASVHHHHQRATDTVPAIASIADDSTSPPAAQRLHTNTGIPRRYEMIPPTTLAGTTGTHNITTGTHSRHALFSTDATRTSGNGDGNRAAFASSPLHDHDSSGSIQDALRGLREDGGSRRTAVAHRQFVDINESGESRLKRFAMQHNYNPSSATRSADNRGIDCISTATVHSTYSHNTNIRRTGALAHIPLPEPGSDNSISDCTSGYTAGTGGYAAGTGGYTAGTVGYAAGTGGGMELQGGRVSSYDEDAELEAALMRSITEQ